MTADLMLGFALGVLGCAGHLAIVRLRVGRLVRGELAPPWPLGLVAPAATVLLAAQLAPEAAWTALLGLVAARSVLLRRRASP